MNNRPYITCRELIDFIADFLEGSLSAEQRAEFERHLQVCPTCVAYLDGYQRTVSLGKAAAPTPDEPATAIAPASLIRAIHAARTRSSKQSG